MKFSIGGKNYTTTNAQGLIQAKKGKTRIMIAVKDVEQRFMLMVTADVAAGQEKETLTLNSEDSEVTVSLRTRQGTLAIMPHTQLAKIDPQMAYIERRDVDTGQTEDDPEDNERDRHSQRPRKRRAKMKSEYHRVKPRWHEMSRADRLKHGEGVIQNNSFRNTFFALRLVPVLSQGKVVSYTGTFSGAGRFSNSISGGEIRPVERGEFHIKVENVR
ncbi:MAG: hypothetical protein KF713_12175 [Turneriella sp.]|nr:hypothetical protein [Turneriella sp.]